MRRTINRDNLLVQGNEVFGISLGFDFTAEHEWGIENLKSKLGVPEKPKNWKDYIIKNNIYSNYYNDGKKLWSYITTNSGDKTLPKVNRYIQRVNNGNFINCFWDQNDFLILFDYSVNQAGKDVFEKLNQLFKDGEMMIITREISIHLLDEDFETGGLGFINYKKLPKQVLKMIKESVDKKENLEKKVEKSGILNKLSSKQKEWREKHPQAMNTPWSYFALSPKFKSNKDSVYDFVFWFNPCHQDEMPSGHITVEDIEDWIEEKGRLVNKDFEKVKFECKNGPFYSFDSSCKYFNFYPTCYLGDFRSAYSHKKLLKLKLDDDVIEKIEGHIKWIIKDHINVKNFYNLGSKPIGEVDFSIDRFERDRIFGFFEALSYLGLGSFDAVNTPKNRENFSWWRDLLESESIFEIVKEYYPDEINDEWYK